MHALLVFAALQQVLPAAPVVPGGLADAREPRVGLALISSGLFADELIARQGQGLPAGEDASRDRHGVVQLGTNFPLLRLGTVVFSLQGGLISRFRLERSDNDQLSSDYTVALPINYARGDWQARVRLLHRSAHLGDELVQNTMIRRLEFDHEEIDALVRRTVGPLSVYGGGTLTVASSFEQDKWGVQLGAELRRGVGRERSRGDEAGWGVVAGVDWQRHSIANGNSRFGAVAGVARRGPAGRVALEAVFQTGASVLGEFFLERERYWGVQLELGRSNGH
ncbi:MAG: DUF1207 domain-containing protein [Gemmatimonadota bacterium]